VLRSLVKDATAHVASWTRLDAVARENLYRQMPYIIGYHRVVDRLDAYQDFALPAMEITVAMLEKHLDWLGRHFEIVSLDDLTTKMNRRARSKPLAAVTFDDGYSDVFYNGFPLLKRKGIPAGIFVVTDLVGTTEVPIHDRLYALLAAKRPAVSSRALIPRRIQNPFTATQYLLRNNAYDDVLRLIKSLTADGGSLRQAPAALHPLSWEMLAEMRDAGMTIGSHSKTHAFLTKESSDRVQQEARDSRAALQQKLGIQASYFAYPGGDFNATVVEAVHAAGYRLAFTICRHRDGRYPMLTVRRRGLWERSCIDRLGRFSPAIMSCHAAAMFGRLPDCPNHH
jgi:peptidoglycan/xylan/chitin deacetylase (PgdA/CDA1 family)